MRLDQWSESSRSVFRGFYGRQTYKVTNGDQEPSERNFNAESSELNSELSGWVMISDYLFDGSGGV